MTQPCDFFILRNKKPVPEPDFSAWKKWYFAANRHVAQTTLGHFRVSTVFLGLNHSPQPNRPILFETIIFDASRKRPSSVFKDQCGTWRQAQAMHRRAVARARALLKKTGKPHGRRSARNLRLRVQ